jgi:hypothetical protein
MALLKRANNEEIEDKICIKITKVKYFTFTFLLIIKYIIFNNKLEKFIKHNL